MASQDTTRLSETFDILTDPHRRYALYYLMDEFEVVGIETLANVIANWESGRTGTDRGSDSERIETALRHTHLPKLADAGVVTFDANTDSVELEATNGHDQFIDEAARIDGYRHGTADD